MRPCNQTTRGPRWSQVPGSFCCSGRPATTGGRQQSIRTSTPRRETDMTSAPYVVSGATTVGPGPTMDPASRSTIWSGCRSPSRAPDTRLTGPARVGRPYVRCVAEQQQMDGGCAPSNRFAFVPARSHSAAVPLITSRAACYEASALSAAQREQTARAAQRRRFKSNPAGRRPFVPWTVDT